MSCFDLDWISVASLVWGSLTAASNQGETTEILQATKLVLWLECQIEELNQSYYHWQHSIIWHFHLNKAETLEQSLCCCPTVQVSWPEIKNKNSPVLSIDSILSWVQQDHKQKFCSRSHTPCLTTLVLTLLALLKKDKLVAKKCMSVHRLVHIAHRLSRSPSWGLKKIIHVLATL